MPNKDIKRGLVPVRHASGCGYQGACNKYYVPATHATSLFVGDPVVMTGDADAYGYASVGLATATGPILGVVVGFEPARSREDIGYLPALTEGYVLVADDSGLECEIQANAAVSSAQFGLNAGFALAAGDPAYRRSLSELDIASAAVTATLPVQIIGAMRRADNDPLDAGGNAKIIVRLNNSQRGNQALGV